MKKLLLILALLFASPVYAQFVRVDCNTTKPAASVIATCWDNGTLKAKYWTGSAWVDWPILGGGSGTVTSVGLSGTPNQITVTGTSPITTSGTWTLSIPTNPTLPGTTTGTFSGNLTGNVTGNVTGNADTVTTNANLTGPVTSVGNATSIANDAVALGTQTTGNYVSSATANQGLLITGTEGASLGLIDCAASEILKRNAGDTAWECAADSTGGSPTFDAIASGTNTTAAMVVGTGGSLAVSGSGTIAATTAAALAANGANCSAGNAPLGVDAAGAVESCFDVATQTELNTHEALTGTSAHGATTTNTASQLVSRDASGNFAAGTITAALSGNATTATALAANGTNCGAGDAAGGVDANGNAEGCFTPSGGSGDITDVWACTTGNCNALTAASGDSLDAGSADASSPTTRSTTLPATCTEGQHHQDTDSGGSETYVCTATNTWTKLVGEGAVTTSGLTMATARLLGRTTASTGAIEELTVSAPITLSSGALSLAGYTFSQKTTLSVAAAATYTTPAGVRALFVQLVGSGGGGGGIDGVTSQAGMASGGNGGGYAEKFITSPSATYTYTITVGGAGGTAGANNGTAGGTTSFSDGGATNMTGPGGNGGTTMTSGTSLVTQAPNTTAVTGTGGDINLSGSFGQYGLRLSGSAGIAGAGGASMLGVSDTRGVTSATGVSALNFGVGGGGAGSTDNTDRAGGQGGAGVIIIWEFK